MTVHLMNADEDDGLYDDIDFCLQDRHTLYAMGARIVSLRRAGCETLHDAHVAEWEQYTANLTFLEMDRESRHWWDQSLTQGDTT